MEALRGSVKSQSRKPAGGTAVDADNEVEKEAMASITHLIHFPTGKYWRARF